MKPVAVVKRAKSTPSRQRTRLCLEKRTEKPKKVYRRRLGRVLSQAQQSTSQNLWALDVLSRRNIPSDGFQVIAAEAARLSHRRRRNAITRTDICSALRELYPARYQAHSVATVPSPETCT